MSEAVRRRLEEAADGLVYLSEADAPFRWVHLPAGELSPAGVARLTGADPAEVEERTLERFFAGHIEEADPNDPASRESLPRYRALREALRSALGDARAFRIGRVEIRCLLIGRLPDGTLGGLETLAVET